MNTEVEKIEVPAGMVEMRDGSFIPKSKVKEIDLHRDKVVKGIFKKAGKLSGELSMFRVSAMDAVDEFVKLSAEEYNAKVGGAKGNVQLYSNDGRQRVDITISDVVKFDERLQVAKALIDECMTDFMKGSNANLKVIVTGAFKVNKQGQVSMEKLMALRSHKIDDERWQKAMEAIADSIQVVGSKRYVRIYQRDDATGEYHRVSLDAANA